MARRLNARRWRPPYLTGGGAENSRAESNEQESFEHYSTFITDSKGRLIEVPLRRGVGNSAFIDQISFSFHEDTLSICAKQPLISDDQYIVQASIELEKIFGFGITEQAKHSGGRFYSSCWLMGTDNAQYGRVHLGGQNNTMLVELTATGCNAANEDWERRLYQFITNAVRPKITRVDVAKDFFNGEYSPEQARADRLDGKFTNHRMMPDGECVGTDWESDKGKGKTYYVGSRESSKYVRVYEKGKQLGDKQSGWVRFEIEFKSKDIVIPFEVLQAPGEYFGGAYPICMQFQEKTNRIHAVKKTLELTFDRCIEVARKQIGRSINAAKAMYPDKSRDEIFALFEPDHDLLPKRLSPEIYSASYNEATPVHKWEKADMPDSFGMLLDLKSKRQRELEEEQEINWAFRNYGSLQF